MMKNLHLPAQTPASVSSTYRSGIVPITTWAEEDRPREKLVLRGKHNLSNAELLAILLGSGSREDTAVTLAQKILRSVDNDLSEWSKLTIAQLKKFKGIGDAKAITIIAAAELSRRRQLSNIRERTRVDCSIASYKAIAPILMDLAHEEFWILLLNTRLEITKRIMISSGGINATVVDVRMVFKKAIEGNACSIIVVHNHPSGNKRPSIQDDKLTKKLVEAGRLLDIYVQDHIIVAGREYYSYRDEGKI
ncbi:MAG: DNA repair protein RadC [Bacteroidota bacterium]